MKVVGFRSACRLDELDRLEMARVSMRAGRACKQSNIAAQFTAMTCLEQFQIDPRVDRGMQRVWLEYSRGHPAEEVKISWVAAAGITQPGKWLAYLCLCLGRSI